MEILIPQEISARVHFLYEDYGVPESECTKYKRKFQDLSLLSCTSSFSDQAATTALRVSEPKNVES